MVGFKDILIKLLSFLGCKMYVFLRFEVVVHYFKLPLPGKFEECIKQIKAKDAKKVDDKPK